MEMLNSTNTPNYIVPYIENRDNYEIIKPPKHNFQAYNINDLIIDKEHYRLLLSILLNNGKIYVGFFDDLLLRVMQRHSMIQIVREGEEVIKETGMKRKYLIIAIEENIYNKIKQHIFKLKDDKINII